MLCILTAKNFPINGRHAAACSGREVLDELRPYLKSDGGDCKIVDIDGPLVKLELMGGCSSCSASSTTMKMGIEKLGQYIIIIIVLQ